MKPGTADVWVAFIAGGLVGALATFIACAWAASKQHNADAHVIHQQARIVGNVNRFARLLWTDGRSSALRGVGATFMRMADDDTEVKIDPTAFLVPPGHEAFTPPEGDADDDRR